MMRSGSNLHNFTRIFLVGGFDSVGNVKVWEV
ncbi:hypothetical protein GGU45_003378 [Niabella hirudinis]